MEPEPNRGEGTSGEKTEPPTQPQPPPNNEEAAAAAAAAACGDATVTSAVALSPAAPGRVLRDRSAGRTLTAAAAAALSASEVRSPGEQTRPQDRPGSGRVLRERTGRGSGDSKSRASPASGLQPAAAVIGDGPAAAAAARRRKAEYPRRRRNAGARGESAEDAVDDSGLTVDSEDKQNSTEKGDTAVVPAGPAGPKSRPTRSRRGGRVSTPRQRAPAENSRATKSRGGPGPLICKAEPDTEQKEYGGTSGVLQSLPAVSEDEEDIVISEEDPPFRDDPKDQNYKPHIERDAPKPKSKPRRRSYKGKDEKEKTDIKLEADVKEENEFGEEVEPPRKRGRRRKDDKSPRLPKRRKKPPIQYVRCEMEGCGTVLAHPRYLQHHIKYQHLLKKKYVCPHPSCGRLFRLQKQLLRHAKHHTDQRDYICEYCARAFKSSHNLAVHRMIHTGEKPLQCEICGFTCRQKASLNWHMKKHDADASYQFSCSICGKRFEKKDSVVAHKAKSHPEILIAEALAANAGALITSTGAPGEEEEEGGGVVRGPEGLLLSCDPLVICTEELGPPNTGQLGVERLVMDPQALRSDAQILGSSAGLIVDAEVLGAATEVLIENSGQHLLP